MQEGSSLMQDPPLLIWEGWFPARFGSPDSVSRPIKAAPELQNEPRNGNFPLLCPIYFLYISTICPTIPVFCPIVFSVRSGPFFCKYRNKNDFLHHNFQLFQPLEPKILENIGIFRSVIANNAKLGPPILIHIYLRRMPH